MKQRTRRLKHGIETARTNLIYETVFVTLALLSVLLLAHEVIKNPPDEVVVLYERVDFWIAWFFTIDYFAGLYATKQGQRGRYWRENWLILLSSIPINEQFFRALRILRVFRVLRLIRPLHQVANSPRRQKRRYRQRKKT